MPYTTETAAEVIDLAIVALKDLKAQAKAASEALAPLAAENDELKAVVTTLTDADAAVDAKLAELAAALAPAETPVEPVVEDAPVVDPV